MECGWQQPTEITEEQYRLIGKINQLKKSLNAVILVHNYQVPEIYKVADFIGDSLELSRRAAETKVAFIVFCGVQFMAETAKLLNPDKDVLLPKLDAICSLADMITPADVLKMKKENPDAAVVCYINTHADVKAVSDICCTSANAVKVVNSLPNKKIIFLPDKNLGKFVQEKTDKEMILWDGHCKVHDELDAGVLAQFKKDNPGVKIIAHPECRQELLDISDYVSGTGGMAKIAEKEQTGEFIIATECGMINKLREDVPGKTFYSFCNFCPYMKVTDLQAVYDALILHQHPITVPESIADRARLTITRMLSVN